MAAQCKQQAIRFRPLSSWIRSTQSCNHRVDPDEEIKENTQVVQTDDKEEIFPNSIQMIGLRPCKDYTTYIETYEITAEVSFCKFLLPYVFCLTLSYIQCTRSVSIY